MKAKFVGVIIVGLSGMANAQVGPAWAQAAGKITNNGSISVKSASGAGTYNAVRNPIGAVAKTNQSAVTQPPTVIVQATSGGYSEMTPLLAVGNNGVYPAYPTCPAGYTAVWYSPKPYVSPVFNVAGSRFNWGMWSANAATQFGWSVDNNPLISGQFLRVVTSDSNGAVGVLCGK
jgi:hypothetical protein